MSEHELSGRQSSQDPANSLSETVFPEKEESVPSTFNAPSDVDDLSESSFRRDRNELSSAGISSEVSERDLDFKMESGQQVMNERPYVSTRFSKPHDPVQPRGGNAIFRVPPGYLRSRSSGLVSGFEGDEETVSNGETFQDSVERMDNEVPPSSFSRSRGYGGTLNAYRDRRISGWRNRVHETGGASASEEVLAHDDSEKPRFSRKRWEGGSRAFEANCDERGLERTDDYSGNVPLVSGHDFESVNETFSSSTGIESGSAHEFSEEAEYGLPRSDRSFQSGNVSRARGRYSRKPYSDHGGNHYGNYGGYGGRYNGDRNDSGADRFSGGSRYGGENYGRIPREGNYGAPRNYGGSGRVGGYGSPRNFGNGDYSGYRGGNGNRYSGRYWNGPDGEGGGFRQGRDSRSFRRNRGGYSSFNPAFPELNSPRSQREPLSLAEELAEEMTLGHRNPGENGLENMDQEVLLRDETVGRLQKLSVKELIEEARRFEIGIPDEEHAQKHDLIFRIIKEKIKLNGLLYGEGTLEILPDGFGFLRSTDYHYLSCPDDIYVSPSQIRRFGLKTGTVVSGQIRPPKENERYFALLRVEAINYRDPNEFSHKKHFDDLVPTHPTQRLSLESGADEIEMRVLDMMVPIGFGHRGLIISPPQAGKTKFLENVAKAALKNYPDLYVFILLVDERPAVVEEMRRQVKGMNCEVICSTFDEPVLRHIQVADMVLEKAKRMVEYGRDVLILLDSISHLARAWNAESEPYGGKMPLEMEMNVIQVPKRFFASARSVEEGGSLTILATLLSETENEIDQMILDEFHGTGNLEIVLDKRLLEKNIFPPIDLNQSGTRHEEMLLSEDEFYSLSNLRRILYDLNPLDAMELLTNRLKKTETNAEFLAGLSGGSGNAEKKQEETEHEEIERNPEAEPKE